MTFAATSLVGLCVVVLSASEAAAYTPYMAGDNALHWNKRKLPLTLVQKDSPLALSEFRELVDTAFTQWSKVADTVPAAQVAQGSSDGAEKAAHNVQFLSDAWPYDPGALAVTVFSYKKSSGELVDADVYINATGPCLGDARQDRKCYDLQAVLTHEAGHFLGLDHNEEDTEAVMFPAAMTGDVTKRVLSRDDMSGVVATYGGQMSQFVETSDQAENQGQVVTTQDVARQGCSATGLASPAWWLFVLMFAGRSRKLLVALVILLAQQAFASSVQREDLSAQMDRADAVFVARSVNKHSYFDVALGFIVTEHTLAVEKCVRGECGTTTVTFRTLGGEVGDLVTRVSGEVEPEAYAQTLFVASKRNAKLFESTAFGQGVMKLDRELGLFRSKTQWLRMDEVMQ